jgi:hypothetical protein
MDKADEKDGKNWEKRFGKDSVTRVKDGQKVKEGAKPDFLDLNKNGNKTEPMKDAAADKKGAAPKKGVNPFAKKGAAPKKGVNPFAKKTNEALKGGQKKLDTDNDDDIDAKDLAALRAKKKDRIKEAVAAKCNKSPKGKSCPVHGLKECGSMYEGNSR